MTTEIKETELQAIYRAMREEADWLNAGDREGYVERGRLAEACVRFGIAYSTAAQAVRVAAAFPESCNRLQDLDWTHHYVVANHEQASELLAWAEETGATVKQLREEKQRRSIAATPTASEASGIKGEAMHPGKIRSIRQSEVQV
jgi:hypothetical protein